ncbi:LysR family transcriptional regulator [Parasphingorhabdus sp.]|uniref:LysR family transcriptional regulator n=1 Tax=Parasphingorhabdus sp. TaxID=2709688 RepID=UPI0032678E2D
MDISLFKDLDRVGKTGNFSQAAELSNISQPAFSRRIKSLEAWVGATLVDRTRQPVQLTEAGAQMLEAGLQSIARIEQERSQIIDAQTSPDKYIVTFGAQHSISWRFYPNWLQAFEDAYGPILSRLRADDLPNCLQDLENKEVDFVICYAHPGDAKDDGQSIVIGQDKLVPVCKPNPDGSPIFQFGDNTMKLPFLRFGDAAPISQHLDPMIEQFNLGGRLQTIYENSMAGALRIRARDGSGIAWLPKNLIEPDLSRGILVQTGHVDWTVDLEIRLQRNKKNLNQLTRSIWSFLEIRESLYLLSNS